MEQLICENITKNYKSKDALDSVNLTLEKGKIYGLDVYKRQIRTPIERTSASVVKSDSRNFPRKRYMSADRVSAVARSIQKQTRTLFFMRSIFPAP